MPRPQSLWRCGGGAAAVGDGWHCGQHNAVCTCGAGLEWTWQTKSAREGLQRIAHLFASPCVPGPSPAPPPFHPPTQSFAVWVRQKEEAKRDAVEAAEAERRKRGAATGAPPRRLQPGMRCAVLLQLSVPCVADHRMHHTLHCCCRARDLHGGRLRGPGRCGRLGCGGSRGGGCLGRWLGAMAAWAAGGQGMGMVMVRAAISGLMVAMGMCLWPP